MFCNFILADYTFVSGLAQAKFDMYGEGVHNKKAATDVYGAIEVWINYTVVTLFMQRPRQSGSVISHAVTTVYYSHFTI